MNTRLGRAERLTVPAALHCLAKRQASGSVRALVVAVACVGGSLQFTHVVTAQAVDVFAEIDRAFDEYRLDAHVPGLVYGVVMQGRLVHVKGFGVQDVESKRPVNGDTLFRIASMTKSFTALSILKLRDDGRLTLDAWRTRISLKRGIGATRRRTRRAFACEIC